MISEFSDLVGRNFNVGICGDRGSSSEEGF